jgi:transcriptional regulator with XRE-family HTH domain
MKSDLIANKIKALRQERAWSQAQLAEIASLSIRTVQRVELNGRCSPETLLALASAFEINVSELTSLLREALERYSIYLFGFRFSTGWLKPKVAVFLSILLVFPAVYFISASILKYVFGIPFLFDPLLAFYSSKEILWWFNVISPAVFLSGLILSIALNLLVMVSFRMWKENGSIFSDFSFTPKAANVLVAALSIVSLSVLFVYAIGENFTVR